jgi:hypothetical protein
MCTNVHLLSKFLSCSRNVGQGGLPHDGKSRLTFQLTAREWECQFFGTLFKICTPSGDKGLSNADQKPREDAMHASSDVD